jgi:hypothetical protein
MTGFQAIILICLAAMPSDRCTEQTAVTVLSKHVDSELGCFSGWQDVIARSAQADGVGRDVYVRTICRESAERAAVLPMSAHVISTTCRHRPYSYPARAKKVAGREARCDTK